MGKSNPVGMDELVKPNLMQSLRHSPSERTSSRPTNPALTQRYSGILGKAADVHVSEPHFVVAAAEHPTRHYRINPPQCDVPQLPHHRPVLWRLA